MGKPPSLFGQCLKVNDFFLLMSSRTVHNVLFGQFEFLATERAETYLKIYVLIFHLTYIYSSSFDCEELKEKSIFVNFKL